MKQTPAKHLKKKKLQQLRMSPKPITVITNKTSFKV